MRFPSNLSLTVARLGKAAAPFGRKVELPFVPACCQFVSDDHIEVIWLPIRVS